MSHTVHRSSTKTCCENQPTTELPKFPSPSIRKLLRYQRQARTEVREANLYKELKNLKVELDHTIIVTPLKPPKSSKGIRSPISMFTVIKELNYQSFQNARHRNHNLAQSKSITVTQHFWTESAIPTVEWVSRYARCLWMKALEDSAQFLKLPEASPKELIETMIFRPENVMNEYSRKSHTISEIRFRTVGNPGRPYWSTGGK